MLLSDLLHSRVIDVDGLDCGPVDDVRLVQDGPLLLPFGHALRVDGIVIGHGGLGLRLGYHHGGTKGPLLLRALFATLARRARFVPWEQVESCQGDVVHLRCRHADLSPLPA
jgi:hypothetical protein